MRSKTLNVVIVKISTRLQGNPRRGFPSVKQFTELFGAPPALFEAQEFRSLRTAPGALPLDPTVFLKKDGQKLLIFSNKFF